MDQFTKEGRKLRPRRTAGAATSERVDFSRDNESSRDNYSERRTSNYGGNHGSSYGEGGYRRNSNYGGNHGSQSYGERREGSFSRSDDGYGRQGGYRSGNSEGGYNRQGGGYNRGGSYGNRQGGGYSRGGYGPRQNGGYNRSEGGYRSGNSEGGYNRSEGGYGPRREGSYSRSEGGYHRQGGNNRSGNSEGGYGNRQGGGYNRGGQGGFKRAGYRPAPGGRNFGPKRQFKKNAPAFSKESAEGINRMISRKPVIDGSEYNEDMVVETPVKDVVRLNKFIANSGVCSRREADVLIQAGVVTVNGEVVTELGVKVNVQEDDIRFNGERLKGEDKVYIVMNKPKGFVTTASDPHAEKTVIDLIKGCPVRVYPVGRLDKNTTGILMLTNDGEIAERLTHPSYDKKKIYQVALDKDLAQEDFDKVLAGVTLSDGEVSADALEFIDPNDKRKLGIEIHSGKNRVVRRIFESLGYTVKALDRVYFAGLTKKGLKKGDWRYLTEGEANILKMGAYV